MTKFIKNQVWFLTAFYAFHVQAASVPSSNTNPSTEELLKSSVVEAQSKMGNLEPWQKNIYSSEVIPQFQRFIRDYRGTGADLRVEVDTDSLKHYLTFYAPRFLKQKNPLILVSVKPDPNCEKCLSSQSTIQQLVRARLERRGMSSTFTNLDEMAPATSASALTDHLASLAKQKGAVGFVSVQWELVPPDDLDTAHADEKKYLIRSWVQIGEMSLQSRQKELLDTDSFESSAARILTDIFTDIGAKIELADTNIAEAGKDEILVDIAGLKDFAQFQRVKTNLSNQLKDSASFEERVFSKGRVVFALYSKLKLEEIKKILNQSSLDPGSDQNLIVGVR